MKAVAKTNSKKKQRYFELSLTPDFLSRNGIHICTRKVRILVKHMVLLPFVLTHLEIVVEQGQFR